ncbi:MAG TPA: hypothetical protein PL085_11460 [Agriterribacter sp.]|uniref:hypothetical protein n=1 Tax=Agriterribacter sp. TaxID=2821509 RepID=UPI002B50BDFC|nr:hypothetical protein [Agriterribacter sp.]HRQ17686.1 hypothetical protein [Agriterribacter sp.]
MTNLHIVPELWADVKNYEGLYQVSISGISARAIETELKLPDSTIRKALTGAREIPAKHIFPIICLLAGYGLKIDGYTLTFDQADGPLTGRKWVENIKTKKEGTGFVYIVKEYRFFASSFFDLL